MAPILWSVLALIILATEAARGTCPYNCKCDTDANIVDCSNAGLTRIPWNLPDPSGLKQLDLSGNHINEIISEIVSYSNLEMLNLSKNQLLTIDDYVLNSLPKLKYLYLQHNQLDKITSKTFNNLKSLLRLDLSHNQLEVIDSHLFSDLNALIQLDLSSNLIQDIHSEAFTGLNSLKLIALNSNRLSNISSIWWSYSPSLNTILLDMNSITHIPTDAFHQLHHLQSLSMEGNGIISFPESAFLGGGKSVLEQLSLKQNKLQVVPSKLLKQLTNLLTLDLSQNLFTLIDPDAFKGMLKLQKLYLNALPDLEIVRKYSFSELLNLQWIEISSNPKLNQIEEEAFIGSPNLQEVDLHSNALTSMTSDLLDWRKLIFLDLRHNPWNCDCKLSFLGDILRDKMNQTESPAYIFNDVKCSSPKSLANRKVLELYDKDCELFKDPPEKNYGDKIIIAVICMFAACVVVCLFVLVWRTRKIQFNTAQSNRPRANPRRRRLHRHRNLNGSCNHGSPLPAIDENEDKISFTEREDSDEVFDDNKSGNYSDNESRSSRKVSFSNYVTVRRCSVEYEDET